MIYAILYGTKCAADQFGESVNGYLRSADKIRKNYLYEKNIFTRAADRGGSLSVPSLAERMILMDTYEEFQIILGVAMLIVAILNLRNKK